MGKKYIIELEQEEIAYKTVNSKGTPMIQLLAPAPYTEPNMEQVRKEAYQKGYETGYKDGYNEPGKNQQEAYQRGLNDAWEAARTLWNTPNRKGIFGHTTFNTVLTTLTAQETIEKIRQYEQEEEMDGLRQNIQTIVDQCGYTFDEIAEVLAKMKESDNG